MSSAANASERPAPERSWLAAELFIAGVAAIVLLIGGDAWRERVLMREAALVRAVTEIQRDVAVAHLWLEELVSGDEAHTAEIDRGLGRSAEILGVLLGERPRGGEAWDLSVLEEEQLRAQAAALARRLEEFRRLSQRRRNGLELGLSVGVGSAIDDEYDALFADVQSQAGRLREALEARQARQGRRSRLVIVSVGAAWGALIALAAVGLWSRERHRRQAEEALGASQAQLLQSQKLEAVGRIAGGLAHDINNFLAAIRGHCELVLMKTEPGSGTARKMEAAIRTVVKTSSLIDRLLALGQPQPARREVVDFNRMIGGLEKMLRPTLGDSVRLKKGLEPELWHVEADPSQLEQILVNLVVNARDAMPAGGEVVLSTANVRQAAAGGRRPQEQVMVAVADTGCGIAPADLDKIFEPFWTTKGDSGNNGLGLATVYSIVRQSGGRIEVESELGRGTTFRVYLPRSLAPVTRTDDDGAVWEDGLGGGETLLLVDDHPEFRESTRALLEALGYRVVTAANGDEALELFAADGERIDLVLTDVVMPGMSGRELVDRLRRERQVKAIFMSGYTDDVVLRHGVERGEVYFVKKQVSSAKLARRIRELLDHGPAAQDESDA